VFVGCCGGGCSYRLRRLSLFFYKNIFFFASWPFFILGKKCFLLLCTSILYITFLVLFPFSFPSETGRRSSILLLKGALVLGAMLGFAGINYMKLWVYENKMIYVTYRD
jgi:hypothetical protein